MSIVEKENVQHYVLQPLKCLHIPYFVQLTHQNTKILTNEKFEVDFNLVE